MAERTCVNCGKMLKGRQQSNCSEFCLRHETTQCEGCNVLFDRAKKNKTRRCRSCAQAGELNHAWRGGHEYWQEGKLGRDKDGLSWKVQRQLAWERDNYTCQDCGKTKEEIGSNPHVDHEIPYRISMSHTLENLKCRCPSCHKRAEAKRVELWGGKPFGGKSITETPVPVCCVCGSKRRKLNDVGRCLPCHRGTIDVPEARRLREAGQSYQFIADKFGVSTAVVWHWFNERGT